MFVAPSDPERARLMEIIRREEGVIRAKLERRASAASVTAHDSSPTLVDWDVYNSQKTTVL